MSLATDKRIQVKFCKGVSSNTIDESLWEGAQSESYPWLVESCTPGDDLVFVLAYSPEKEDTVKHLIDFYIISHLVSEVKEL